MRLRIAILLFSGILALCVRGFGADALRPVVGPGATKDEVIAAYGWPNGQSRTGSKEILSYAQGEVILQDGRVERVNFSPDVPWQAPKPAPAPPTASTRKAQEIPVDFWMTDFDAARAEAARRNCRVLALFTGSDWSPASKEFHDQVEYDPAFVNAFAGDFVFLRLDYPRGNPVPAQISPEKQRLRDRYGVTVYPTLLILGADGELVARVDLSQTAPNRSFRDRVIDAVASARDGGRRPSQTTSATTSAEQSSTQAKPASAPQAMPAAVASTAPKPLVRGFRRAAFLVISALVAGAIVVGFILWQMWRPKQPGLTTPVRAVAERIDDAAGGLPSRGEMSAWSRDKLRAVVGGLAEFDNYQVRGRSTADVDLEFRRQGDTKPRVLVVCVAGAGSVPARVARELFGSMAAEGAEVGWVVSTAEFAPDTTAYAAAHRIVLVGVDGLHAMMRDVPPVSLPAVLARG